MNYTPISFIHSNLHFQEMADYTLSKNPTGNGNRGPHRWSLGGLWTTGHLLHRHEWVQLIDPPAVTPILNVNITFKAFDFQIIYIKA